VSLLLTLKDVFTSESIVEGHDYDWSRCIVSIEVTVIKRLVAPALSPSTTVNEYQHFREEKEEVSSEEKMGNESPTSLTHLEEESWSLLMKTNNNTSNRRRKSRSMG